MSATFSTVVQLAVVNPAEIRKFFDLKPEIPLSDEDIATRECPEMADHMKMEGKRHRFAICEFDVARPGLVREPRYLAPLEDSGSAHWTNCACSRHRFKCPTGNR